MMDRFFANGDNPPQAAAPPADENNVDVNPEDMERANAERIERARVRQ